MASNIVPIVIDDDAFRGTVTQGLNGFIFKNEEEYINCISKLYCDKRLRYSLSVQARIQSEHLSSSQYADNVLVVYERAINNRNKYQYGIFSKISSYIRRLIK